MCKSPFPFLAHRPVHFILLSSHSLSRGAKEQAELVSRVATAFLLLEWKLLEDNAVERLGTQLNTLRGCMKGQALLITALTK